MTHRPVHAPQDDRPARFATAAGAALEGALAAGLNAYDRTRALARFHRLSPDSIASESADAARAALKEIERAMRGERARRGHWSYGSTGISACSSPIAPRPRGFIAC
ncbi:MAG: hypothetical protein WC689_11700 [Methylocystis sp.]|jgi:hypothetical protein